MSSEDNETQERHIELQREYIKLLEKEIQETAPLAAMRGWVSTQIVQGEELRQKLNQFDKRNS
jgi:hypothetical protein